MKNNKLAVLLFLAVSSVLFWGCENVWMAEILGRSKKQPAPEITVEVRPAQADVVRGGSRQFTATVKNSENQAVNWSVSGNTEPDTIINSNGLLTVSLDEIPGTELTVTAVSAADTGKSGKAVVTVTDFDLTELDPPASVTLAQTGGITVTPGDNSDAAEAWYTFTLYRDADPVSGFVDIETTDNVPADLVAEMLSVAGEYTVGVKAHTANTAEYLTPSDETKSGAVFVWQLDVTISGGNGTTDTVYCTPNYQSSIGQSYTASFSVRYFNGVTLELLAEPGTDRYVTWSGDGTGDSATRTVTLNANAEVTATFAAIPDQPEDPRSITIEFAQIKDMAPLLNEDVVIYRSGPDIDTTFTFTLANPAQYKSRTWVVDGILSQDTPESAEGVFILDATDWRYNDIGMHTLRLIVEVVENGADVPYSRTIRFEVKEIRE